MPVPSRKSKYSTIRTHTHEIEAQIDKIFACFCHCCHTYYVVPTITITIPFFLFLTGISKHENANMWNDYTLTRSWNWNWHENETPSQLASANNARCTTLTLLILKNALFSATDPRHNSGGYQMPQRVLRGLGISMGLSSQGFYGGIR